MTKATKTQIRGICQCCGREQAVIGVTMSKHGYTVEHGWFEGVCSGQNYRPMQESRAAADAIIATVRDQCTGLRQRAADLTSGAIKPETAFSGKLIFSDKGGAPKNERVAFALAPSWHQESEVKSCAWNALQRAKMGEEFCNMLAALADKYHGQPLITVAAADRPAAICSGERRTSPGGVLVCKYVDGARVYWTQQSADGRTRNSWTGTQAWRKLPLAA